LALKSNFVNKTTQIRQTLKMRIRKQEEKKQTRGQRRDHLETIAISIYSIICRGISLVRCWSHKLIILCVRSVRGPVAFQGVRQNKRTSSDGEGDGDGDGEQWANLSLRERETGRK